MVSKPARSRQLPVHPNSGLARPAGSLIRAFSGRIGRMHGFSKNCFALSSQTAGTKYVARKKVTLELRIPEGLSLRGRCVGESWAAAPGRCGQEIRQALL